MCHQCFERALFSWLCTKTKTNEWHSSTARGHLQPRAKVKGCHRLTVSSPDRPPAEWQGKRRGKYPDTTACPSHTRPLCKMETDAFWIVMTFIMWNANNAKGDSTHTMNDQITGQIECHFCNKVRLLFMARETTMSRLLLRLPASISSSGRSG